MDVVPQSKQERISIPKYKVDPNNYKVGAWENKKEPGRIEDFKAEVDRWHEKSIVEEGKQF